MEKKRKDSFTYNMDEDESGFFVDQCEIMKLTKMAKAWEFTCSFCFKKFPSAQAMGGHQNAHRSERLEERRLFIKDPIAYRKMAYTLAMKEQKNYNPNHNSNPNQVELMKMETNAAEVDYFCQTQESDDGEGKSEALVMMMNFLPPKELNLADSVGRNKGKTYVELNGDGYGLLDLTLKL